MRCAEAARSTSRASAIPLDPETMVRVSAGTKRKLYPGDEGMRVLVIGGVPGKAYAIRDFTELGAPDPFARS